MQSILGLKVGHTVNIPDHKSECAAQMASVSISFAHFVESVFGLVKSWPVQPGQTMPLPPFS